MSTSIEVTALEQVALLTFRLHVLMLAGEGDAEAADAVRDEIEPLWNTCTPADHDKLKWWSERLYNDGMHKIPGDTKEGTPEVTTGDVLAVLALALSSDRWRLPGGGSIGALPAAAGGFALWYPLGTKPPAPGFGQDVGTLRAMIREAKRRGLLT